jgi:DNA (cytosine-5)-methyltransferase 1
MVMVGYTTGVLNRRDEGMKFGSLFAGVGGFDLGFESAGMECCFQVEWDKYCQQVLAYHWPQVPRWSDVSDVNGAELPPVDIITFGSPCQDLSVAGKRAGLEGDRSNLFFEATRIIREMRNATNGIFPRMAIWENVRGAFSSNEGHDFGSVLDGLAESGALGIEWAVLDARWFGVPQRRRRIFVIAEFDPARANRGGKPILAVGKGSARDLEKSLQARPILAPHVAEGTRAGGLKSAVIGFDHKSGVDNQPSEDFFPTLKTLCNDAIARPLVLDGQRVNDVRVTDGETSPTLTSRMGTGGNTVPMMALPVLQQEKDPGGTAYEVRRLTEIECERLMGWPDNHTLYRADGQTTPATQRYKMCGNGVVAPVAKWVAEQILASEPD